MTQQYQQETDAAVLCGSYAGRVRGEEQAYIATSVDGGQGMESVAEGFRLQRRPSA